MIRNVLKARPDGRNHHIHDIPTIDRLNGKPEHGENHPRHNGNIAAPESPTRPRQHGEGGMIQHADRAVQADDPADDDERGRHNAQ